MRVAAEKSWYWMLFEDDDRLVLTVLCNVSAFYFDIAIELSTDESACYVRDGESFLESLAASVQWSPDAFRGRHLPDFHTDPRVAKAVAAWRALRD